MTLDQAIRANDIMLLDYPLLICSVVESTAQYSNWVVVALGHSYRWRYLTLRIGSDCSVVDFERCVRSVWGQKSRPVLQLKDHPRFNELQWQLYSKSQLLKTNKAACAANRKEQT